jgi:hypothetical protein
MKNKSKVQKLHVKMVVGMWKVDVENVGLG